eukprot:1989187-Amphidinium_carterae.1
MVFCENGAGEEVLRASTALETDAEPPFCLEPHDHGAASSAMPSSRKYTFRFVHEEKVRPDMRTRAVKR